MSSSPRRNQYTRASYNGISAGVVPHEGSSGSPISGGVPGHHSIEGKLGHGHGHITPGAVGLAGVAQRSAVAGLSSPVSGAPDVNAEAAEYYGGKEVWSRSRTYSNVSFRVFLHIWCVENVIDGFFWLAAYVGRSYGTW